MGVSKKAVQMSKDGRSVAEVIMMRVGFRKAYGVFEFVGCWLYAEAKLGRPLEGVTDFQLWWKTSASGAFKRQSKFRECFPEFANPHELWEACGFPSLSADRSVSELELVGWRFAS